jgi:hypothetical protein
MRKSIYIILLLSVFACGKKDNQQNTTNKTKKPVVKKVEKPVKTIKPATTPLSVEAKNLYSKMNFVYVIDDLKPSIDYMFEFDNFTSLISANNNKNVQQILGVFKKELTGANQKDIPREFFPRKFRRLIVQSEPKGKIVIGIIQPSKNAREEYLVFYEYTISEESRKFIDKIGEQVDGGIMIKKGKRNWFSIGDKVVLSTSPDYLKPGMEIFAKMKSQFSKDTLLGINANRTAPGTYFKFLRKDLYLGKTPLDQFFNNVDKFNFTLKHSAKSDVKLELDMNFTSIANSITAFLQKTKPVNDFAKYIHKNPVFYLLDGNFKSGLSLGIKLAFSEIKRESNKNPKDKIGNFLVKKIEKVKDELVKSLSYCNPKAMISYKWENNKLGFRSVIQLSDPKNEKLFIKSIGKTFKLFNPKLFLKGIPKRGKKIASKLKFLKIKTSKIKFNKNEGVQITLNIDWKNVPNDILNKDERMVFSLFIGQQTKLVFMPVKGKILVSGGKNWKKEINATLKANGKIPHNYKIPQNTSFFAGINTPQFILSLINTFGNIKPLKYSTRYTTMVKIITSYLAKENKGKWVFLNMNNQNKGIKIKLNATDENRKLIPVLTYLGFTLDKVL